VTGRTLPDLRAVCPEVDAMFDAIVAENGALVYFPDDREIRTLGAAPEPALVEALRRHEVPFALGASIIGTREPFAEAALAAIRVTGVERTLVFNKGSLMLLPGGVTKGTGLEAALAALDLSPHNMAGIGDAENDHAFLAVSECAVAVADAVPALRERADYVTRAPAGAGVVEFVEEHLLRDLVDIVPRLERHHLALGRRADGSPVGLPAHGTRLLVVGPSGTGKSTLTGVLVERVVDAGRSVLLLDPEGDYQTLAELEGVVVLGGRAEQALPAPEEIQQLLRQRRSSLVLDLSALTRPEKVAYATAVLAAVAAVRSSTGLPHWLLIDEAHHMLPAEGSPAVALLGGASDSVCLTTLSSDLLAPELRPFATAVASTELETFRAALRAVAAGRRLPGPLPVLDGAPLEPGEMALACLAREPAAVRLRVGRR
ncbi:MAG TPA: HAD hydrolase family protein, partial [Methylomirabilota bacterium]|nr:HAD hydrolase family protein [Methylomirabilota bacterium]